MLLISFTFFIQFISLHYTPRYNTVVHNHNVESESIFVHNYTTISCGMRHWNRDSLHLRIEFNLNRDTIHLKLIYEAAERAMGMSFMGGEVFIANRNTK